MKTTERIIALACSWTVLFLSACAGFTIVETEIELLPVEVVASDKVTLKSVRVINKSGDFQVKGQVKPKINYLPIIYGHIDIELIDNEGRIIEQSAVYTPKRLQKRGGRVSYFSFSLGDEIKDIHQVRVSFHDTANSNNKKCNNRTHN